MTDLDDLRTTLRQSWRYRVIERVSRFRWWIERQLVRMSSDLIRVERDEDGTYIVSDNRSLGYGHGHTRAEALADYVSMLSEMAEMEPDAYRRQTPDLGKDDAYYKLPPDTSEELAALAVVLAQQVVEATNRVADRLLEMAAEVG